MIINLVVAATENNVIGKHNKLLWHLPNDLAYFKNITWGMPVIMGRKTYESMGKPLKGRTNIVITSNRSFQAADNVIIANALTQAIEKSGETDAKECYVIGGGEIFKSAMPIAERIYMTRVHTTLDGDTFFPEIDKNEWECAAIMTFAADEKHAYSYTFETWTRK